MTPAKRSLDWCKQNRYVAQVVERWNPFARIRQDLFGFIDIVAITEWNEGILGIQATVTDKTSARLNKILNNKDLKETLRVWLSAKNKFQIHGWAKRGPRGKRKLWELKRIPITLNDLGSEREPVKMMRFTKRQKKPFKL